MRYKIFLIAILALNGYIWHDFSRIVVPIKIVDADKSAIQRISDGHRINHEIAKGIYYAARANGLDPELYATLIKSESDFQLYAVSSANYKGIAQTPSATGRAKTDLMHGAEILSEKLRYTGGDMEKALHLYKGSRKSKRAEYQAMLVWKAYIEGKS